MIPDFNLLSFRSGVQISQKQKKKKNPILITYSTVVLVFFFLKTCFCREKKVKVPSMSLTRLFKNYLISPSR